MKIFLYIVLSAGFLLFPHGAQASLPHDSLDVDIYVRGNKRTKKTFIEYHIKKCIRKQRPEQPSDLDARDIEQCLYNTRLFSNVHVRMDKSALYAEVRERWTLIPIPRVSVSDDSKSYGAFVLESNFLGYGKLAGIGGALSTEGDTFFLLYRDPALFFTNRTAGLFAKIEREELFSYDGDRKVYGYDRETGEYRVSLGYDFVSDVKVSASLGYTVSGYGQIGFAPVPDDASFFDVGLRTTFVPSDYKLYFNEGLSGRFDVKRQISRSDGDRKSMTFEASVGWDKNVFDGTAVQLGLKGVYMSGNTIRDSFKVGYRNGYRGIPRNGLWVEKGIALSCDYQIPLKAVKSFVWTLAPFVDFGVYDPVHDLTDEHYVSYGIGTYLFPKKINIPGIGFIAGNNETFMGNFVTFFIGIPMR